MSNAIMKAMASGLPVITTDIPENRILIQDNKTGILVPPHSIQGIFEALQNIVQHEKLSLSLEENATNFVRKNFSIHSSAIKLSDLIHSL